MSKLRSAATVVLARPSSTPCGVEVAVLHRNPKLRFLGGFWVFPGGRVDRGETEELAALRETFEETGLLLLDGAAGRDPLDLRARREALLTGEVEFDAILDHLEINASGERLIPAGRWITPPFAPVRFDTVFYLAGLPADAPLDVIHGELDSGEWLDPQAVVDRWRADEALLAPPTRITLEALIGCPREADQPLDAWLPLAADAIRAAHPSEGEYWGTIDFRPGLRLFLVRTPTLPPATHTNCLIVGDGSELVVIDAASPYDEERARLDARLDELAASGRRVRELILTHHHPDHSSGTQYLADRLGVPIAAHARTRELLAGRVQVTRTIEDGELIELPGDLPGSRDRRLRAILCEGHADGHLAFYEETTRSLIAGDMIAGVGTIIIDPPEGKMGLYLESLRKLEELDAVLAYPSHGPPIGDPPAYLRHYVDHRLAREEKILGAVKELGPAEIMDLVPMAYDDKPPKVFPFAARAALAHLEKLSAEGRVVHDESVDRWRVPQSED